MTEEKTSRVALKSLRYILMIIMLLGFAGLATFAVMSDTSVHGLTVRFSYVQRYCNVTGGQPILTFNTHPVIVYSSNSLPTSLSHVTFAMSVAGVPVGTTTAPDSKFNPGQSYSYFLIFSNPTLDPHSQPLTSQIVLTINAQVSAGLYKSPVQASDTEIITFPGPAC